MLHRMMSFSCTLVQEENEIQPMPTENDVHKFFEAVYDEDVKTMDTVLKRDPNVLNHVHKIILTSFVLLTALT